METLAIFIPLIVAAISFTINVLNNIRELNYKKQLLEESKISDKRKELAKKINEFYGPFLQNLKKSTTLYRALTINRGNFRLLDSLLDENKCTDLNFNENDKVLIKEIVDIGRQQQELIKTKGGLIDDPVLTVNYFDNGIDLKFDNSRIDLHRIGLIPRANAHYRILELAHEKKLSGDVQRFQDYRFPRNLPDEIERRFIEIQIELEQLRTGLLVSKRAYTKETSITVRSYDNFAKEYDKNVSNILPLSQLTEFVNLLPNGARILDLGCGSGRDVGYFLERNFNVLGVDLSKKLIKIAKKKYPMAEFRMMDMRKLKFKEESFDGIWASASLLHLSKSEIKTVLRNLLILLKKNGIFYLSLKEGFGEVFEPDLRYGEKAFKFWSFYTKTEIQVIIENIGFRIIGEPHIEPKKSEIEYMTHPWISIICYK